VFNTLEQLINNVLFVTSSPRGQQSYSQQVARGIVDDLKIAHPEAKVVVRNVARYPLPHIGEAFVNGLANAPEQRSAAESEALARSDGLIGELMAADVLVLAVPMHNFGLPSSLKAWIDHVVRAGLTFRYGAGGPEGLVRNKRAIVVVSRGGVYSDGPMKQFDFQEAYLKSVLGFIGITDFEVVRVEGLAMGEQGVRRAMASAKEQSAHALRELA
jgi:FMN-dependent NADH-azoreductase